VDVSANIALSSQPLPPLPKNLRKELPQVEPWKPSEVLQKRLDAGLPFCRAFLLPTDPEYAFVTAYFNHQKPPGMRIKEIHFLFHSNLLEGFERGYQHIQSESEIRASHWKEEACSGLRKRRIKRWHRLVNSFSPKSQDENIVKTQVAKIAPLWRTTTEDHLNEIANGVPGFQKLSHSFDLRPFGRGFYFTSSAKYAALQSKGLLLLSWVSMREPYPVISDVPQGKASDIIKLRNVRAYEQYNAHYIAVAPLDTIDPELGGFGPCKSRQKPHFDELVVFDEEQILPQFLIELEAEPIQKIPFKDSIDYRREILLGNLKWLQDWLIADPSRLSIKGCKGETLFYYAAQSGHVPLLDFLYEKNSKFVLQRTEDKPTPLYAAVLNGKLEAAKWIHNKTPRGLQQTNSTGWNLAHVAAFMGHASLLDWLIETQTDFLNKITKDNWSLVYVAAMGGRVGVMELLKQQEGWSEIIKQRAKDLSTPLHAAAFRDQQAALAWLVSNAPDLILAKAKQGNFLVHWAALGNAIETLRWMMDTIPDSISQRNRFGETGLHLAAKKGNMASVLQLFPALCKLNDSNGRSVLHLAVLHNQIDVTLKLIELGLDPFATTSEGENIFHFCSEKGHTNLLQELIKTTKNRDGFYNAMEQQDSDGKTPLHKAVWHLPKPEIVQMLLQAGSNVNARNHFDYTPLHWAAKHNHLESAKLLLQANAMKYPRNKDGDTPFDLALRFNAEQLVLFLINPDIKELIRSAPKTEDPKSYYYRTFEQAYETSNPWMQVLSLEKHAAISALEGKYIEAAQLLNSAHQIARQCDLDLEYREHLLSRLEGLEGELFQQISQKKVPADYRGYLKQYQERLREIRRELKEGLDINQSPLILQGKLNAQLKTLLVELIQDSIKLFDTPPTRFAVLALGSMGRNELSPYSDVEFAFLIKDSSKKYYFRDLTRFLELRIVNLGETLFEMIRPNREVGRLVPKSLLPKGFSMDSGGLAPLGKEGVYELIGTPKELARFQSLLWQTNHEAEMILINAMAAPSRLFGDESLVKEYRKNIASELNKKNAKNGICQRRVRALQLLKGHYDEFSPWLGLERLSLQAFDVKRDFYRPIQILIDGLALYYGLEALSTFDRIEELVKQGVFSKEGGENLQSALMTAITLRLRVQLFYGQEKEIILYQRTNEDAEYFSISPEETNQLIEIYRVQVPLYKAASQFLSNPKRKPFYQNLYEDQVGSVTLNNREKLAYSEVEQHYVQATVLNPKPGLIGKLGDIKLTLGQATEALTYQTSRLDLLKKEFGNQPNQEIIDCLSDLSNVYQALSQFKKSEDSIVQALLLAKDLCGGTTQHPGYINPLRGLGHLFRITGRLSEALTVFEEVLVILNRIDSSGVLHSLRTVAIVDLGMTLMDLGQLKQALYRFEESLELVKQSHDGMVPASVFGLLANIGLLYQALDDLDTSISQSGLALAKAEELYEGKLHPDIASLLGNLGSSLRRKGDFEGALQKHKRALEIYTIVFKDEPHQEKLCCLNNLASIYLEKEETANAEECLQKALSIGIVLYGKNPHPYMTTTYNNLACLASAKDQRDEARSYHEQSLQVCKQLYGEKPHPHTVRSLSNLGRISTRNGLFPKAISYFEQALNQSIILYNGQVHSAIAEDISSLGEIYHMLGQLEEACKQYEKSLGMYEKISLGKPDKKVALTLCLLGAVYEDMGLLQKGYETIQRSFEIYQTLKEQPKGVSIECSTHLSFLGFINGYKPDKSDFTIKCYQNALELFELIYQSKGAKDHPHLVSCLNRLALAHKNSGAYQQAADLYQRALNLSNKLFENKPHLLKFTCLSNLGNLFSSVSQFQQAKEFCQKAVEMARELYADTDHAQMITCLNSMGSIWKALGQLDKALESHLEALTRSERLCQNDPDQDLAVSLNNVGTIYEAQGKCKDAIPYYEKSLAIRKQLYQGQPHPRLIAPLNNLFTSYLSCGDTKNAKKYLKEALSVSKQVFSDTPQADPGLLTGNLGTLYLRLAKPQKAIGCFADSLHQLDRIFPDQANPIKVTQMHNLALTYLGMQEYEKSSQYILSAHEMVKKLYPNQPHPLLIQNLDHLVELYRAIGQLEQAAHYALESLAMKKSTKQDKSSNAIVDQLNVLSEIYGALGKINEAQSYKDQALKTLQSLDVQVPIKAIQLLVETAVFLFRSGQKQSAQQKLEEALAKMNEIKEGEPNHEIAGLFNSLGVACLEADQLERAVGYLKKALHMKKRLCSKDSGDVYSLMGNLALAYQKTGNLAEAAVYQQKCVKNLLKINAHAPSWTIVNSLNSLGMIYRSLNNLKKAIHYLEKCIEISKLCYDPEKNRELSIFLANLGLVYAENNQLDMAASYYLQSIELKRKVNGGRPDYGMLQGLKILGVTCYKNNNLKEAVQYWEEFFSLSTQLEGNAVTSEVAATLLCLASSYDGLKNLQEAKNKAELALSAYRELSGNQPCPNQKNCLTLLQSIYQRLSNHQQAKECAQKLQSYAQS